MDIGDLKKLIKKSTAVLVLDSGEPSFVIVGYDTYKNLVDDKVGEPEKEIKIHQSVAENSTSDVSYRERETEILDRLNKEIHFINMIFLDPLMIS